MRGGGDNINYRIGGIYMKNKNKKNKLILLLIVVVLLLISTLYDGNKTLMNIVTFGKYNDNLKNQIESIMQNQEFIDAIKNHKYIKSPYLYEEELLDELFSKFCVGK